MTTYKINKLIYKVLNDKDISISPNQKEQVKSILLKKMLEEQWDQVGSKEVMEIIDYVDYRNQESNQNFLAEFSVSNFSRA